jgi:hypothetical protein
MLEPTGDTGDLAVDRISSPFHGGVKLSIAVMLGAD